VRGTDYQAFAMRCHPSENAVKIHATVTSRVVTGSPHIATAEGGEAAQAIDEK
jgi:hypothetical protein